MRKVTAYTDGSCNYKTRRGGAGAYLVFNEGNKVNELFASKPFDNTKTGRMEISAVILALESIQYKDRTKTQIHVISDSQYVVNSIQKWLVYWEKAGLDERTNGDLWIKFLKVYRTYPYGYISISWVKGHKGILGNEVADALAYSAYKTEEGREIDIPLEEWPVI